jgi:hypothetical protein
MCALTAVAPIVRFNALDIFVTPTFLRASDFSSRTSDEVQTRLTDFFLAISISVPFCETGVLTHHSYFATRRNFTAGIQMPTIHSGLADKLGDIISATIGRVREIFSERPANTVTDSIPKRRDVGGKGQSVAGTGTTDVAINLALDLKSVRQLLAGQVFLSSFKAARIFLK